MMGLACWLDQKGSGSNHSGRSEEPAFFAFHKLNLPGLLSPQMKPKGAS